MQTKSQSDGHYRTTLAKEEILMFSELENSDTFDPKSFSLNAAVKI